MNNNDSFIDKQLVETGFTFFLINKNDVKNVFKQQDSEQSRNDDINNTNNKNKIDINDDKSLNEKNNNDSKDNKNNNSKNNYINNQNNINKI